MIFFMAMDKIIDLSISPINGQKNSKSIKRYVTFIYIEGINSINLTNSKETYKNMGVRY